MANPFRSDPHLGRHVRPDPGEPERTSDVNVTDASSGITFGADIVGPIAGEDPNGVEVPIAVHRLRTEGQVTSDQGTHQILRAVLAELRQLRLHMAVLTGEDFNHFREDESDVH